MERAEVNISRLKKDILNKKLKIQILNFKINEAENDYLIEDLVVDLKKEKIQLGVLDTNLNKEIALLKKEKDFYKKSLNKVKECLNEFAKNSRTNTKLKKHSIDINNIINLMEKYLNT